MILNNQRIVSHLDMDAFFVSVECLRNSKLKGAPLLIGGHSDRAVVAACSYEARKFGIHSAMPMKLARRLCPQATIISGDFEQYSHYSSVVTDIIRSEVPRFEKASIDEFYIDMTGMDRFFGCSKFTTELRRKIIRETGLPVSYGLATNKLVSKVATNEAKPNGQLEIPYGQERSFLAPLPIQKMPMIGTKTAEQLQQLGIRIIKTLSEIPSDLLTSMFGKTGTELWRRANGIDETPVTPYREQKGMGKEETFEKDTIDLQFLEKELAGMTQKLAFELRRQNRLAGCITVKLRYSNFDTVTRQCTIPYTCSDHLLMPRVRELFRKLYDRRLLVRLVGVRFTHLIPGSQQIDLFQDSQEMIRLYKALDSVNHQYGRFLIMWANGMIKP